MRNLSAFCSLLGVIGYVLAGAPAHAQTSFTWVASAAANGNDSHDCQRATPCATFSHAISQTGVGGTIFCVDSGDFGGLIITHSLTIDCGDAISNTLGQEVQIDTAASDIVILEGLTVNGYFQPSNSCDGGGITFSGAGMLEVRRVRVNSNCNGIFFGPSGPAKLEVSDSYFGSDSGPGPDAAIFIRPASGVQAGVIINRTQIGNCSLGVLADGRNGGTIRAAISDSVVSDNTVGGIVAISTGSSVAILVDQTKVTGNSIGLYANGSNAGILVGNTRVFNNTTGLETLNGGKLLTSGNNTVIGNPTPGAFTGTAALQ